MNEEEFTFLKTVSEKMKRTGEFTEVTHKRVKAQQTEETAESFKAQQASAEVSKAQQATSTQNTKAQMATSQVKNLVNKKSQNGILEKGKTFAASVIKDWYNKTLQQTDSEFFDKINGCFCTLQASDWRAANYWLTQLEKGHMIEKQAHEEKKQKKRHIRNT